MKKPNSEYRILYIEDEIDVRENIAEVLRDEGFQVIEADDANEGLTLFMQKKPDIVISDILMPIISGYDLLKKIRNMEKKYNPQVPFIFLSALSQKEDIIKGTELSANDYLTKPVDIDILIAKVKEKLYNVETINKTHDTNIKNIYHQVSNTFSKDMATDLNILIKMVDILKSEPYGPLGHRGYSDIVSKMNVMAQKLKSIATTAMNRERISNKVAVNEETIEVKKLTEDLIKYIVGKTERNITLNLYNDYNHKIRFNALILRDILSTLLMQIVKITTNDAPIRINFFVDHENNFIFAFHGVISPELVNERLDIGIELKEKRDTMIEQGGDLDFRTSDGNAIALINIPKYKVMS